MATFNSVISQPWPSNENFVAVALAIAGLLGHKAFNEAHRCIISAVEETRHHSYPVWFNAYERVFQTHLAVKTARDELER